MIYRINRHRLAIFLIFGSYRSFRFPDVVWELEKEPSIIFYFITLDMQRFIYWITFRSLLILRISAMERISWKRRAFFRYVSLPMGHYRLAIYFLRKGGQRMLWRMLSSSKKGFWRRDVMTKKRIERNWCRRYSKNVCSFDEGSKEKEFKWY